MESRSFFFFRGSIQTGLFHLDQHHIGDPMHVFSPQLSSDQVGLYMGDEIKISNKQ